MVKLDEYDLKILRVLQRDGRTTKVKLAEKVGLSPSPTWERLRRLEKAGVITGYQASLDPKSFGSTTTVMVEVLLKHHGVDDFKRFETAVTAKSEVVECLATGGGVDYIMRVVVRDIDTYQRFMDNLLETDVGIDRYFSFVVTKPVKTHSGLPLDILAEDLS
ncbi:MAG: Lrp/AsnC family transcriptional regulator [Desulfofustis sp.]|jgi:Lrp/AsnC family transcriptional regulator, regulator of ectoine-degradation genes